MTDNRDHFPTPVNRRGGFFSAHNVRGGRGNGFSFNDGLSVDWDWRGSGINDGFAGLQIGLDVILSDIVHNVFDYG